MEVCLEYYEHEFMELVTNCPSVVCCRCSPEQKAQVVRLIQRHSNKTCAAIGDGGNDVSMIQAASAGIGIVGKFFHSALEQHLNTYKSLRGWFYAYRHWKIMENLQKCNTSAAF